MMITDEQKANLAKLADYLDAMTPEYAKKHFAMSVFMACPAGEWELTPYQIRNGDSDDFDALNVDAVYGQTNDVYACGTCACAIGHGPAAGIAADPVADASWDKYSQRALGISQFYNTGIWSDLFGPQNPDDPKAAAERIRAFLLTQQ